MSLMNRYFVILCSRAFCLFRLYRRRQTGCNNNNNYLYSAVRSQLQRRWRR